MLINEINNLFKYKPYNSNLDGDNFKIPDSNNNINKDVEDYIKKNELQNISTQLNKNVEFLKIKYNTLINSDIKIRDFYINVKNQKISCILIFVDGLTDDDSINDFILKPLFFKNSIKNQNSKTNQILNTKVKKLNKQSFEKYILSNLIPQNSIQKEHTFKNCFEKINSGFCALFVDGLDYSILIETKKSIGRNVENPITESVVKGSHEGFVETLRTNTALLRKIINNENLIIEETTIGKINKTKISICYMKNITNDDLVAETKYRLNNLRIDFLISTGQLEGLIKDNFKTSFPETISTERPDKVSTFLLLGRVAILINGSPFAIILPATIIDFLTSEEDYNINYHHANFLKLIRTFAFICALLVPGFYVAITMYHFELIPSELLFAIISSREAIPFPIIFEIIIMEISFELIQEASIRVSSSFSTTIGIIGALILGDAAVSANIVSPILIIIVAFSGICAFSIPDNQLRASIKMFRFMYIILGYLAGFLGIAAGFFLHFLILSNQTSFGIPFFSPYIPFTYYKNNENLYVDPIWKREKRNKYLNTKKPTAEEPTSMEWRKNEK